MYINGYILERFKNGIFFINKAQEAETERYKYGQPSINMDIKPK
jgi:hypothetical protein